MSTRLEEWLDRLDRFNRTAPRTLWEFIKWRATLLLIGLLVILAAFTSGCAPANAGSSATLRGTPRFGFPPLKVTFTLELRGDDEDALWCPAVGWSFGDESRSFHESDCAPREQGERAQRFYSTEHTYKRPAPTEDGFLVVAAAWRAGRLVAKDELRIGVRE